MPCSASSLSEAILSGFLFLFLGLGPSALAWPQLITSTLFSHDGAAGMWGLLCFIWALNLENTENTKMKVKDFQRHMIQTVEKREVKVSVTFSPCSPREHRSQPGGSLPSLLCPVRTNANTSRTHSHAWAYAHTHTHTLPQVYTETSMHTPYTCKHKHDHMYARICTRVWTHTVPTCAHTLTHTCTHICTYSHTHTCMYINIHHSHTLKKLKWDHITHIN